MIIDHKIVRNSGSTLEPCIYKSGPGTVAQGRKMLAYPHVFAPVLGITDHGYCMPRLNEPSSVSLSAALDRLVVLWNSTDIGLLVATRAQHHETQVAPLATEPLLRRALEQWHARVQTVHGTAVNVVHGDPTLENYMYNGVWLDPSTRPLPLEAELDGGKLLQSYFGYGHCGTTEELQAIRKFIHTCGLNLDLCAYYLVTHLVRLYRVQPQAQFWAVTVAETLEERMEDFKCK
jgi:hypothetical protein